MGFRHVAYWPVTENNHVHNCFIREDKKALY